MNIVYITRVFNPRHDRVNYLRGGKALKLLIECTALSNVAEIVDPDPDGRILFHNSGIVFFDLSMALDNIEFAEGIVENRHLIVDVHFPVLNPNAILSYSGDLDYVSEDGTHKTIGFWSRPETQRWVRVYLANAHAITTPHIHTYRQLKKLNPRTFLLPDVTSPKTALKFCKQFLWMLVKSADPKMSIVERAFRKTMLGFGWIFTTHQLRSRLSEAVAQADATEQGSRDGG